MADTAFTEPRRNARETLYGRHPEPVAMVDGSVNGAIFAPSRALDPRRLSLGWCRHGRKQRDMLRFFEAMRPVEAAY